MNQVTSVCVDLADSDVDFLFSFARVGDSRLNIQKVHGEIGWHGRPVKRHILDLCSCCLHKKIFELGPVRYAIKVVIKVCYQLCCARKLGVVSGV
jgi:hypothetical protein